MSNFQAAILAPIPACGRYLSFSLASHDAPGILAALAALDSMENHVIGIGSPVLQACGGAIKGLRSFARLAHAAHEVPSTQDALWIWLRADDRGDLVLTARKLTEQLSSVFRVHASIDAFRYHEGRDLSGYVDGTENPQGDAAVQVAIVRGSASHLDGSSFVAVQQWVHNLDAFEAHTQTERDHIIGRTQKEDIELEDAPAAAHVKRTAQESFSPEAFVVRRSMPWADEDRMGLVFVAFGHSLDAFEVQMRRMLGLEDGIADALFSFTRPVTGAYYWCPPMRSGSLDLRALGA